MKNIMDRYIHEYILLHPSFNDFIGLKEYNYLRKHWENSLTDEFIEKERYLLQTFLLEISKKSKLNIWEETFKYDLEMNLKLIDSPMIYLPLNHLDNPILMFIELSLGDSIYNFDCVEDYDFFIIKTQEFDIWCQTALERMKQGIQKKYVLPKLSVVKMISQLKNALKSKDYKEHKTKSNIKLDYDFVYILDQYITKIITYVLEFLENIYLKHSTNSIGFSSYPNGKKYYRLFVESECGLNNLTIRQIYNKGLKEVKRIKDNILNVKNNIGFDGNYHQFLKHINDMQELKFKNKDEMGKCYIDLNKKINKTIMQKLFPDKIQQVADIKPVPSYMEDGSPAAYYMPGDIINKRKGVFYYNSQKPQDTNKYEAISLSLHENCPGHHYQITMTNLNPKIPIYIKLLDNNAYIEGWGLYSENLGSDGGLYDDYTYLGKLNMEMLRAIRLVVDTGIHYYGWTFKECFLFFQNYSNSPEHEIETEIYRYIVDPAQALSYKIGEITLLKLRHTYLTHGLTIQQFHHDVLIDGPLPLNILTTKLDKIVSKHKKTN